MNKKEDSKERINGLLNRLDGLSLKLETIDEEDDDLRYALLQIKNSLLQLLIEGLSDPEAYVR